MLLVDLAYMPSDAPSDAPARMAASIANCRVANNVYDKATGEYLSAIPLPTGCHGNPITYMHQGKQYIAFTGGGDRAKPVLVVLSLPGLKVRILPYKTIDILSIIR